MLPSQLARRPDSKPDFAVTIVEGPAGAPRQSRLKDFLRRSPPDKAAVLDGSLARRGPWAGVGSWIEALVDTLLEQAPDLAQRHSYEILSVAPSLRRSLQTRYRSLTDVASEEERVRLFPRDRAVRIPHGLIDLLIACVDRGLVHPPLEAACDAFDEAGVMTRRFFGELVRRAGPVTGVHLVLGVDPGSADKVLSAFPRGLDPSVVRRESCTAGPEREPTGKRVRSLEEARRLEALAAEDPAAEEALLPALVNTWELVGDHNRALHWRAEAFARYTFLGLYEDAWEFGKAVAEHLDEYAAADGSRRYRMLNKIFGCVGAIGDEEEVKALPEIAVRDGLERLSHPSHRAGVHYMLAMLHARFLPELDLEQAEEHLELGLAELERSDEEEASRRFQIAFNRNGLALIRFRQGHAEEAIALCRRAREELDEYLPEDRQRLHRSVLLYNVAQVYSTMDRVQEAIDHLSQAIAMDPEYSEYYNDRGMLLFRAGRLEQAKADFLRAIDLSPPYHEVWTNLGQCLRRAGDLEGARRAYDRTLDLEPEQPLALMGRGDCYQELGDLEAACEDYTAALEHAPESWDCLANRAVVLYELGRVEESLADLDRAVELAPEAPELRQNRAVALADLGRLDRARSDLERYLELASEAPDRREVIARIEELAGA